MAQKEYLNNAGLEHYDEKIKEYIGDNTSYDIVALKEVSPAESTHNIGEYIAYNHIIYQVIDDISIGDTLVVNTNIEQAVLPEGTVIYSDDEQGGTGSLSYNDLSDKPQIAGTTLQGNKSLADLGIASANDVETALDTKVDKVAGKGLSENDYSDEEKGKVADNSEAIEVIENVTGAKNLFDSVSYIAISGLSGSNGTYTNTIVDSRDYFDFVVMGYHDGTLISEIVPQIELQQGDWEFNINIPSGTNRLQVKHNGARIDLSVLCECKLVGSYILSLKVTGADPTTVGGLTFGNIMIRPAGTDPTYVPFAMTNRELTERKSNFNFVDVADCTSFDEVRSKLIANKTTRGFAAVGTAQSSSLRDILDLPSSLINKSYVGVSVQLLGNNDSMLIFAYEQSSATYRTSAKSKYAFVVGLTNWTATDWA